MTAALLNSSPLGLLGAAAGGYLLAAGLGAAYLSEVSGGVKSARVSAHELRHGDQAVDFLFGSGLVGVVAPLVLTAVAATGMASQALAPLAAALGTVGVMYSRKSVLQAGVHAPVL